MRATRSAPPSHFMLATGLLVAERMGAGAGTLAMVEGRTYKAMGLSQPREGYRTEFYIHLVPANA